MQKQVVLDVARIPVQHNFRVINSLTEEQQADDWSPTITLTSNGVLAGLACERPGLLIPSGARRDGVVRGRSLVGCPGREGW